MNTASASESMKKPAPSMGEPGHLDGNAPAARAGYAHRLEAAVFLLRRGQYKTLLSLLWETFFGVADMMVLRLELGSFRSEHLRRYALTVRTVEPRDAADFFDIKADGLTGRERRDVAMRTFMLNAGIQTCYVVEDSRLGKPCFLQWLIPFSENNRLHQVYGAWYPDLRPDEAMIEHAYVMPSYRGNGLLPCATAKILEIAREAGVRRIVTFIPTWNTNSLKSFMRLGFTPYMRRTDRKFFGIRYRREHPAPEPGHLAGGVIRKDSPVAQVFPLPARAL